MHGISFIYLGDYTAHATFSVDSYAFSLSLVLSPLSRSLSLSLSVKSDLEGMFLMKECVCVCSYHTAFALAKWSKQVMQDVYLFQMCWISHSLPPIKLCFVGRYGVWEIQADSAGPNQID